MDGILTTLLFFVVLVCTADALEPSQCIAPLGMESGAIRDRDISASSSFDDGNVAPHHGRLRNEINGGAWCPQSQATPETKEWIEINLHTVHMITATETQGRFGNGQGVEFSESYVLEYWRPKFNKWVRYRAKNNGELLKGNINTYLEQKTLLDPPIWASKIRFYPYSSHKRTVCMRVEVYGCPWSDGVISYSMPQGDKRGNWEFYDLTYDGHWNGEKLKYGLGQLTDGQVAPEDFKLAFHPDNTNMQGWIGWKSDSRDGKPVEIVFEFDKVREFSSVQIYTNNQFAKDVQVFSEAKVAFSIGGKAYKGEPITYTYIEDKIFETPRNVSIKLHHRVGRFVKVQLYFASKWILISEVSFESVPVSGNFTEELLKEENSLISDTSNINNENINNKVFGAQNNNSEGSVMAKNNVITAVNSQNPGLGQYLGIIVGVLAVLVLFMIAIVLYIIIQQRRYKSSPRPSQIPGGCDKAALYREPSLSRLTTSSDYADVRDPEYAVPLQQPPRSPRTPPNLQNFFPKPPSCPPSDTYDKTYHHQEFGGFLDKNDKSNYYAATEICHNGGFVPPPPPLSTPPPVRLSGRQPRYVTSARTYVGP